MSEDTSGRAVDSGTCGASLWDAYPCGEPVDSLVHTWAACAGWHEYLPLRRFETKTTRGAAMVRAAVSGQSGPACGTCGISHTGAAWSAAVGWHDYRAMVSPFTRRALAGLLPAKVLR